MPSTGTNAYGFELGRNKTSMTRSKRGSGKLAFNLNITDGNASSRYKRPVIPKEKVVVTEQMMDDERAKLLGEKQTLLTKITKRHDALVCFNV